MKKYFAVASVMIVLSVPAFAQTQATDQQKQSAPAGMSLGSVLMTGLGVVGGVLLTDYALGGNLAVRLVGLAPVMPSGYLTSDPVFAETRQAGAVVGERIAAATAARDVPARMDLVRGMAVIGSGLLGGLAVLNLSK